MHFMCKPLGITRGLSPHRWQRLNERSRVNFESRVILKLEFITFASFRSLNSEWRKRKDNEVSIWIIRQRSRVAKIMFAKARSTHFHNSNAKRFDEMKKNRVLHALLLKVFQSGAYCQTRKWRRDPVCCIPTVISLSTIAELLRNTGHRVFRTATAIV